MRADKAYDSNALRATIAATGVIPPNRTRKIIIPHDVIAYRHRNRIERCFNRLKARRFATRYDRRAVHFTGFTAPALTGLGRSFWQERFIASGIN